MSRCLLALTRLLHVSHSPSVRALHPHYLQHPVNQCLAFCGAAGHT